jgi:homoserine dehydrogenase
MKTIPLIVAGYGHVGRAFITLLKEKKEDLAVRYGLGFEIMALVKADGSYATGEPLDAASFSRDGKAWTEGNPSWQAGMKVSAAAASVAAGGCLVDCTPSELHSGEPGLSYIQEALDRGLNVATASKGALVVAFRRIMTEASAKGLSVKFSGATAAALPTVDVGMISLAAARIEGIQGVLNGTSNYILTRMGEGLSYADALQVAQSHGIAEPDPSYDVEGLDSAAKLVLIANACLGTDFIMDDVRAGGISGMPADVVRAARAEGKAVKLLAAASPSRKGKGWSLHVGPSVIDPTHPLFHVNGTEKGITFLTDTMGSVTVTGGRSSPRGAAAALLKDLVNIYRQL